MRDKFDKMLAFYGAPTLIGIKAGTVISLPQQYFSDWQKLLNEYNRCLECHCVRITLLKKTEKYILIFIYQEKCLEKVLKEHMTEGFLHSIGYHQSMDLLDKIAYLKTRIATQLDFPHEIGLFLGFPFEDVIGFCHNQGKNYKMNGYWKVYGDLAAAKRLFNQYTHCSNDFCERLARGEKLLNMLKKVG